MYIKVLRWAGANGTFPAVSHSEVALLTDAIAEVLRRARLTLGLTQKELARRAGVSHRLWGEVERGERPNVSLEAALRMLAEAGITLQLADPLGNEQILPSRAKEARHARAALRRVTWRASQGRLGDQHDEPEVGMTAIDGLGATAHVSAQAYAVSRARRAPKRRK